MPSNLNCFDWKQRFNLNTREPIIMFCCGNTACRECVTNKMIKNKENAEKGLAKKGEFKCSKCECKYNSFFDTDLAVPI